jgi:hypothetical protein
VDFLPYIQALIIRDFSGVDPSRYHEAIAAQLVACPRSAFIVERDYLSPKTGTSTIFNSIIVLNKM